MADLVEQLIEEHLQAVAALKAGRGALREIADLIVQAFKNGHRVYVAGNGGSAADAQHIAAELVGRFKSADKPALPAMALTTDTSALTAIGNDFGFEEIFRRQVQALVRAGDVLWALSVSGTSPNVLAAVDQAKDQGAHIIGFTGRRGTELSRRSDVCLVAEHEDSDRVQEVHQLAYHVVCALVERAFVGP